MIVWAFGGELFLKHIGGKVFPILEILSPTLYLIIIRFDTNGQQLKMQI
jgi:hypothetical protein